MKNCLKVMLKGFNKFTKSVIVEMWKMWWVKETTSFFEGFIEAQLNTLKWLCYEWTICCERTLFVMSKGPGIIVFCWQQTHALLFAGSS